MENAKNLVEQEYKGCEVVYGDTDSLFVLCKGSSRAEAFEIGQSISKRVTSLNPHPVKLNFEKAKKF